VFLLQNSLIVVKISGQAIPDESDDDDDDDSVTSNRRTL
jgi:hypothetical protein